MMNGRGRVYWSLGQVRLNRAVARNSVDSRSRIRPQDTGSIPQRKALEM